MFAVVIGVADEALLDGVDDEVQTLERNLADQDGTIIGDFGDIAVNSRP